MSIAPSTNPNLAFVRDDHPQAAPTGAGRRGFDDLRGRTVLVTGARGFLGRHLVRRLMAEGAEVHATTRAPEAGGFPTANPTWHRCEVTDATEVAELVDHVRPGVVCHLASRVEGRRDHALALPMLDANTRAAVAIMEAAQRLQGCRVVLAGSVEEPRAGAAPCSPYAAAKAATTAYAQLYAAQWLLPVTVLRIAMVYGPDQPDETKLVPYSIRCFLEGTSPELASGARLIDWVYIDDVVDAFVRAATSPNAGGLIADIGSGHAHSILEVVTRLAELTGYQGPLRFGDRADRPDDVAHLANPRPARSALDWRSHTDLNAGLARTVQWHRQRRVPASRVATG